MMVTSSIFTTDLYRRSALSEELRVDMSMYSGYQGAIGGEDVQEGCA